jgi:hypothetical protein
MSVRLMDQNAGEAHVLARLRSRDYWTIIVASEMGGVMAEDIEARHYTGEAAADFELFMVPAAGTVIGLCFAHKRRMTPDQMSALSASVSPHNDHPGERDVLCAPDTPLAVAEWLADLYDKGSPECN